MCTSRGPDGLLRAGIMRRAGSAAAGWGGSQWAEVWEADTDESSHTFLTGATCSWTHCHNTTHREKERVPFIPPNDEKTLWWNAA